MLQAKPSSHRHMKITERTHPTVFFQNFLKNHFFAGGAARPEMIRNNAFLSEPIFFWNQVGNPVHGIEKRKKDGTMMIKQSVKNTSTEDVREQELEY